MLPIPAHDVREQPYANCEEFATFSENLAEPCRAGRTKHRVESDILRDFEGKATRRGVRGTLPPA